MSRWLMTCVSFCCSRSASHQVRSFRHLNICNFIVLVLAVEYTSHQHNVWWSHLSQLVIPPWTEESLCLSVCLSVCLQIRARPITFWSLTLAYHIWHIGVSPWYEVSRTLMIQILPWTLTLRSNLQRFWHVFASSP